METTTGRIGPGTLIPELLREHPEARSVLDRYGLRGCGGPEGPSESLAFFARVHDVPLPRLVAELNAVSQAGPKPSYSPGVADRIYRPFFLAGMAVALTFGAGWGAYLLVQIARTGSFRSAGLHAVNAHGHAQIFGWVGLFVMGFAYQAFPRFKHTELAWPWLAVVSLVLMLTGIVGRALGEPLADSLSGAGTVAVIASALEVVAIALFLGIVGRTWRRSGTGLAFYDGYVLAALVWFLLQAIGEAVYLAATLAAPGPEQLVVLVATWQGALREAQIHGFALLMILGVSQRLFPTFYEFPTPNRRLSLVALGLLNAAVVGEVLGLILMRSGGRGWAALWYGSVLVLAATVAVLVVSWRIFGRAEDRDRSLKFLRAAYVWLLVSLGMLALLPVYQYALLSRLAPHSDAAQIGFSHAYYGAVRHAITVGFVSLMIVGVAAKVVPTLNGLDVRRLGGLWIPFVLLNVGCALRVTAQVMTDFTPAAFPLAGASGLLEFTGLTLWAGHLVAVMAGRARTTGPVGDAFDDFVPGMTIAAGHRVGEVLDTHPELLATFVRLGFRPLANPLLRATVARWVTIGTGCRRLGLDTAEVLAALNAARRRQPGTRVPLNLLRSC